MNIHHGINCGQHVLARRRFAVHESLRKHALVAIQRGVIRDTWGAVLVAFANCLAATSPNAVCTSGSLAIRDRISLGPLSLLA